MSYQKIQSGIFSYYNQLFDVMIAKRMINLSCILDLSNYLSSLERWLEIYQLHQANPVEQERYFNLYLRIVKPHIHKYHHITTTLNQEQFGFYSDKLQKQQIEILRDVYKELIRFEILDADEFQQLQKEGKSKKYKVISNQAFKGLLKNPVTSIFLIPLKDQPKNQEFKYWGSYLKVNQVQINSKVIHGKGIAKKELGFPTANLLVDESAQLKLKQHPNGVYLVQFAFVKGTKFTGICCIGTNPHYENLKHKRLIQVYVYHDFLEDFYDQQVQMKLLALVRFEGKFQNFDCFLNAMHNDIEMGKNIAKQLNLTTM